mmetsp:Transcript_33572/g.66805  ORF Transcript_33572/g.66805 Transcript_33572/m.66805 type:complete len:203 (+) Transcript_33572:1110-1718(+)
MPWHQDGHGVGVATRHLGEGGRVTQSSCAPAKQAENGPTHVYAGKGGRRAMCSRADPHGAAAYLETQLSREMRTTEETLEEHGVCFPHGRCGGAIGLTNEPLEGRDGGAHRGRVARAPPSMAQSVEAYGGKRSGDLPVTRKRMLDRPCDLMPEIGAAWEVVARAQAAELRIHIVRQRLGQMREDNPRKGQFAECCNIRGQGS